MAAYREQAGNNLTVQMRYTAYEPGDIDEIIAELEGLRAEYPDISFIARIDMDPETGRKGAARCRG